MRKTVMILADGARYDTLSENISNLPALKKIAKRGSLARAVSVWPSTTGPAHLPFLSGAHPGDANLPGIRWFDRQELYPEIGLGALRLRSYVGWKSHLLSREIDAQTSSLFEQASNPRSVLEVFSRGLDSGQRSGGIYPKLIIPKAHFSGKYRPLDLWAKKQALEHMAHDPDFLFVMLPGIDGHSHHSHHQSEATLSSYRDLDDTVSALLEHERPEDEILWIICSDHGHYPVSRHVDLENVLAQAGLRTACHSRKLFQWAPEAVVCVSGNSMAHLYIRSGNWRRPGYREELEALHPKIMPLLLERGEVDIIVMRSNRGVSVISRLGEALLEDLGDGLTYRVSGSDPFGYEELPEKMSLRESLELTAETHYPDAPAQIVRLMRSSRSGDIILSASPGSDFRDSHEFIEHHSGHGALHKEHMNVPLLASEPLDEGPCSTQDVYSTVCDWMNWTEGPLSGGRSLLQ